jgi:hypothetical protein
MAALPFGRLGKFLASGENLASDDGLPFRFENGFFAIL